MAMHMIDAFSLGVIRLQLGVRNWPGRRDAAVVFDFAKILLAQAEKRRAVKFGVATHVIIRVWMQLSAVGIAPELLRVVAAARIHLQRVPVLFLARNKWTALEQ